MDDDVLHGHMQHHWVGATGGTKLFERIARTHPDPATAAGVGRMAGVVAEEREELRQIMHSVGATPSLVGSMAARAGEMVARLKPNGHILTRSPLTDILELEALRTAVSGKRAGWQVLRGLAEDDPLLDHAELDRLVGQAEEQLVELEELHRRVAQERLRR